MLNTIADFTDNNLVNIIRYGDEYFTSSEVNFINQINPVTLDTTGRVSANVIISWIFIFVQYQMMPFLCFEQFQIDYRNHIALNLATAHPHYDEEGNTYNMGTAILALSGPKYVIFKVPAKSYIKDKTGMLLTGSIIIC